MKRAFFFLILCLFPEATAVAFVLSGALPVWLATFDVACLCGLTAGIGGVVYRL